MKPSIIIADDHPLILKGLQNFLVEKDYNIIGHATNGEDAYELIRKERPDIAILDIRMPKMTGLEVAKLCNSNRLILTKIILITFERNGVSYNLAKQLNVFGFLLKEFALIEIEHCLQSVIKGEPYFSPEFDSYLSKSDTAAVDLSVLSQSEELILKLISQNKRSKEIAESLHISRRTVDTHKRNIVRKLNIEPGYNSLLIWAKENQEYII